MSDDKKNDKLKVTVKELDLSELLKNPSGDVDAVVAPDGPRPVVAQHIPLVLNHIADAKRARRGERIQETRVVKAAGLCGDLVVERLWQARRVGCGLVADSFQPCVRLAGGQDAIGVVHCADLQGADEQQATAIHDGRAGNHDSQRTRRDAARQRQQVGRIPRDAGGKRQRRLATDRHQRRCVRCRRWDRRLGLRRRHEAGVHRRGTQAV